MKIANFLQVLFIMVAGSVASPARAMNVDEAIRASLANSHDVKQIEFTQESARWGERKAFAGFLPKLDLKGNRLLSEKFQTIEIEFGGANFAMPALQPYTSLTLDASIDLFDGFADVNELRSAQYARESADHELDHTKEKVRTSTRTLFYRALGSQVLVEVTDQNIRTLEGHLKDVNARVRSGVSTRFDVLRTEVQLEDARTEKAAAENSVAIARAKLFEALGVPDDMLPLSGQMPEDFNRFDANHVKLDDVTRADRAAQVSEMQSRDSLSKAAKSHWLPTVSLFGDHEWYNNTSSSIFAQEARFKTAYAVGLRMKWNLFDGGAELASQRQAEIAKRIAQEKLEKLDQAIPVDLEESKRRYLYNVTVYKAKLSSIRKAEEAVRLARGGLRAGIRTNTEVLDAVVDLNRAKAASVKSQVEAIEALGNLELAIGHPLAKF